MVSKGQCEQLLIRNIPHILQVSTVRSGDHVLLIVHHSPTYVSPQKFYINKEGVLVLLTDNITTHNSIFPFGQVANF